MYVGAKRKCHSKTRGVVFNKQHVIPSRLNDTQEIYYKISYLS